MTARESRGAAVPVVVGLVTGLAAVVALGSHGTPLWTLLRSGHADRSQVLTTVTIACVAGGALASAVVVAYHRLVQARVRGASPLQATMARAAPAVVATITALGLAMIAGTELGPAPPARPPPGHVTEESGRTALPLTIDGWGSKVRAGDGPRESAAVQADRDTGPGFPFPALLGVTLLALLAASLAWRRFATGATSEFDEPADAAEEHREAMHGAFVGTIDAMLEDPDPRTAIRGAYARLLEGLAASGARRFDHEGPVEHLQRVLRLLDIRPASLRELIGLFGMARFSTHPLSSAHRDRALGALRAVAADLETGLPRGVPR